MDKLKCINFRIPSYLSAALKRAQLEAMTTQEKFLCDAIARTLVEFGREVGDPRIEEPATLYISRHAPWSCLPPNKRKGDPK